jgi:hypothetical protein
LNDTTAVKIGKKFNRLTVISDAPRQLRSDGSYNSCWTCQCDCGTMMIVRGSDLKGEWIKACGKCRYESTRKRMRSRPYHWMLAVIKYKKESSLTYQELLEFTRITRCHYCEDIVEWHEYPRIARGHTVHKYNLDRKDNSIGYSKENCVVCCSACNYLKGDKFTYNEMMELGKTLKALREERHRVNLPWIRYYTKSIKSTHLITERADLIAK